MFTDGEKALIEKEKMQWMSFRGKQQQQWQRVDNFSCLFYLDFNKQ